MRKSSATAGEVKANSHFKSLCALNVATVVKSMGSIDFMFHDGGHYKENYIRDFSAACTALVPGSVVLFDDIRYESRLFRETPHHTYEGWMEVVAHPRVKMAVEVSGELGLLLLR